MSEIVIILLISLQILNLISEELNSKQSDFIVHILSTRQISEFTRNMKLILILSSDMNSSFFSAVRMW